MSDCKHHKICGLGAGDGAGEDYSSCILHSRAFTKDIGLFNEALNLHRKNRGDNFRWFQFPEEFDFSESEFKNEVHFNNAEFWGVANFTKAKFYENAYFVGAQFHGEVDFREAKFKNEARFGFAKFRGEAKFSKAKFFKNAYFLEAQFHNGAIFAETEFESFVMFYNAKFWNETAKFHTTKFKKNANFQFVHFNCLADFGMSEFMGKVEFGNAEFNHGADFLNATFARGANFICVKFKNKVSFVMTSFLDRTVFIGEKGMEGELVTMFADTEVIFNRINLMPLDALVFRNVDLRKCQFSDTDLREVEFTNVIWPKIGIEQRICVYDEVVALPITEERTAWYARLERIYRELKQNFEDRRDYERAGDFHYNEKQMRRMNPDTSWSLKFFLTLYFIVSGYGERYLRPLFWCLGLLVVCAALFLVLGIYLIGKPYDTLLDICNIKDWGRAIHYSLQTMMLMESDKLDTSELGDVVRTIESLLGPIFLGFFALALRQRLKR